VQVSINGLLDYAGNAFSEPTAQFTTAAMPDFTSATVSFDFPWYQTGIGTNASFNCLYSKPMDPSSITSNGTYVWSFSAGARVPVTYTFSADMMSATMTPTAALPANSEFYYSCQSAFDLTGNAESGSYVYFYTGAGPVTTGPTLVAANPPNGFTNVPVNTNNGPWYGSSLGLLFSEPVASDSLGNITLTPNGGSPIPIAVYPEDGNFIVWVQLPWALAPNTTYTYSVTGVTDINGNPMTPAVSTFTTGSSYDFSSPTVASASPANGVTTTGIPAITSITFSEAIDPVLINTSNIYLQSHNTQTIVPTTLSFSADYTTVYLTPMTPLAESTIYDLVIYGNNFWPYDIAGNSFSASGYVTTNNGYVYSEFTTGTAAAVDGACGTANGGTFSAPPPAANLCSAGIASAVTNPGSWTWTCNGYYGGANASCSAAAIPPLNSSVPASEDVILSQVNWLTAVPTGQAFAPVDAAGTTFAVNSSGNILLSTQWGNQVLLINGQTSAVTVLGTYNGVGPVTIDSLNNLYVASPYSNVVVKVPYNGGAYATVSAPTFTNTGVLTSPAPCTGSGANECGFAWNAAANDNYLASAANGWWFGVDSMNFDSAGDLFYSLSNANTVPNAIFECSAACLGGTGSPIMVYQEPQSPTTTQLNVGSMAVDPWGNLFFTDSALNSVGSNESEFSHLYELSASAGAGYGGAMTGFAAAPTVLYTLIPSIPSGAPANYDDEVDGVAVDTKGTVYFAIQYDGIFAFPNNGGTLNEVSVASSMYTVSTQGSKLLTLDAQGNAYVVYYGTVLNPTGDTVGRITVNNLTAPTTTVGVAVTTSATLDPVTTILNDGGCAAPETVGITSSTSEFSAVATTSCSSTLSGGSSFPTTITFTPAATGKRSATLTTTDSDGNTGSATVSGVD